MNFRREFEIAFVGLKPGLHEYEFRVDEKFFANYNQEELQNCKAIIKLQLDRKNSFMLLKFDVDGTIKTDCDRCGNSLELRLWEEFNLIVKLVDNPEAMNEQEEDPDVYFIGKTESHLHLADWIYEFVNLSIPMQRMCSQEEMGGSQCNQEVLLKLQNMENAAKTESQNSLSKALEKFKNIE